VTEVPRVVDVGATVTEVVVLALPVVVSEVILNGAENAYWPELVKPLL
jgi:hypothetical protein